jgi:hypothetical protein
MAPVSTAYLELAAQSKAELAAIFASGGPPDVSALAGFEFRGFNQPRATALLGIRKFIKAFYLDRAGQPFGCNTPIVQNGLEAEWLARPSDDRPTRYAFFQVQPPDPNASDPCAATRRSSTTDGAATGPTTLPAYYGTTWSASNLAQTSSCSARHTSSSPGHASPTPTSSSRGTGRSPTQRRSPDADETPNTGAAQPGT